MKTTTSIKFLSSIAIASLLWGCPPKTDKPDTTPDATTPPVEQPTQPQASAPQNDTYLVVKGDSLWTISGKPSIYGNPYQWPLIYKANRDKIKDADLIYPGQELTIERGVSEADRQAAVEHAKTRGAWSVGPTEASDEAYLNQ